MKILSIGPRIIKTGIAVTITMFICRLLNLEPAFFGAVAAVINMQPSIFMTLTSAKNQFLIHFYGVSTAIVLGYLIGGHPLSMGLITIIIIVLYRQVGLQTGISTGVVAGVFILSSSADQFLSHALTRTAVIFTGLITAMVINVFLWPPRYNRQFRDKIMASNQETVKYFRQAIADYAKLQNDPPDLNLEQKRLVHGLKEEVRVLAGFFKKEGELLAPAAASQGDWYNQAKRFVDYNESLIEKADRIYELLPGRYERRMRLESPPISAEFQAIMDLLTRGGMTVDRVNSKLRGSVIYGAAVQTEEINEAYWENLTEVIECWHPTTETSYYIHAMIEISVMANEIKSAAREGKKLLVEVRAQSVSTPAGEK